MPKIIQSIKMAKIVQNNIGQIIRYSNIFVYFGRIYSFAKKYSWMDVDKSRNFFKFVLVPLSASVERVGVSGMQDFLKRFSTKFLIFSTKFGSLNVQIRNNFKKVIFIVCVCVFISY